MIIEPRDERVERGAVDGHAEVPDALPPDGRDLVGPLLERELEAVEPDVDRRPADRLSRRTAECVDIEHPGRGQIGHGDRQMEDRLHPVDATGPDSTDGRDCASGQDVKTVRTVNTVLTVAALLAATVAGCSHESTQPRATAKPTTTDLYGPPTPAAIAALASVHVATRGTNCGGPRARRGLADDHGHVTPTRPACATPTAPVTPRS